MPGCEEEISDRDEGDEGDLKKEIILFIPFIPVGKLPLPNPRSSSRLTSSSFY
jgi:hypothetical protein